MRLVVRDYHRKLLSGEYEWGVTHLERGATTYSPDLLSDGISAIKRKLIEILNGNGLRVDVEAAEVRVSAPAEFTEGYVEAMFPDDVPPVKGMVILSASRACREDGTQVFLCRTLPETAARRTVNPEVTSLTYVVAPATHEKIPEDWCIKEEVARRLNGARHRPNHYEVEADAWRQAHDVRVALEYHRVGPFGGIPDYAFDEERLARKRAEVSLDDISDFLP